MGTIILVRHGESVANRDRHFAESGENPLTELGLQQARELAPVVASRFRQAKILSSAFLRARQTAAILSGHLRLPVEVIEGIHERDFGSLKGLPYQHYWDMKRADPLYDPARDWIGTARWREPGSGAGARDRGARASGCPVCERGGPGGLPWRGDLLGVRTCHRGLERGPHPGQLRSGRAGA